MMIGYCVFFMMLCYMICNLCRRYVSFFTRFISYTYFSVEKNDGNWLVLPSAITFLLKRVFFFMKTDITHRELAAVKQQPMHIVYVMIHIIKYPVCIGRYIK